MVSEARRRRRGAALGIGDSIVRQFVVESARIVVPDLIDSQHPIDGVRYIHCNVIDRTAVGR